MNLVDEYFLEHRGKLIDLAAFLDRVDRAGQADDRRIQALRGALQLLLEPGPERARRILELLSDPTSEPVEEARGSATGAP